METKMSTIIGLKPINEVPVITDLFVTIDNLFELFIKLVLTGTNNTSEFIYQVAIKLVF